MLVLFRFWEHSFAMCTHILTKHLDWGYRSWRLTASFLLPWMCCKQRTFCKAGVEMLHPLKKNKKKQKNNTFLG